jgi:HD-like signal output (HDOD) protein/CheY-like chemotaxis protein
MTEPSTRILFVDDEVGVLQGLERMLFELADVWDMAFVDSGERALNELSEAPYDVIVSDMRMPGMDGATLLAHVRSEHPKVVRIILTGHSEQEATLRAMGVAHGFLTKPCKPAVLQEAVRRSSALRTLLDHDELRTLVGGIAGLPVRPETYAQLTEAIAEPGVDLSFLARIVSHDTALASKVLHLTNSAFFGARRGFTSVEQAVTFIGVRTLKRLVLAAEVFRSFDPRESLGGLSLDAEQRHGLACAGIARQLSAQHEQAEVAFLAGMLHDIGKLVIATRAPKLMRQLNRQRSDRASLAPAIEQRTAGASHARIGAYLLGLWGLEAPLVHAVAYHHDPDTAGGSGLDLPTVVHIADALAHDIENERAGHPSGLREHLDLRHLERLGLLSRLDEWRARACELWDRESW